MTILKKKYNKSKKGITMNIDRIRDLIQIEKEKYLSQYDDMDIFLKYFDISECNTPSAKRIDFYKSCICVSVSAVVGFVLIKTFPFFKDDLLFLLQVLLYFIAIIMSGTVAHPLLSNTLDKRYAKKIYSKTKTQEERLKLLDSSFANAFNNTEISNEIFNDIKVQLSKEEYIELRTQHAEKISYQELKIFLNEKERTQKISDEQQNIILTAEQIKAYSSRNIEA